MFDIGFWELTIIAIIALLVVGPDRLPGLARTVGLWVGKIRRFLSGVKNSIDRELQADKLRKMIKPSEFDEVQEMIEDTRSTVTDTVSHLSSIDSSTSPSTPTSTNPSKNLSTDTSESSSAHFDQPIFDGAENNPDLAHARDDTVDDSADHRSGSGGTSTSVIPNDKTP